MPPVPSGLKEPLGDLLTPAIGMAADAHIAQKHEPECPRQPKARILNKLRPFDHPVVEFPEAVT